MTRALPARYLVRLSQNNFTILSFSFTLVLAECCPLARLHSVQNFGLPYTSAFSGPAMLEESEHVNTMRSFFP